MRRWQLLVCADKDLEKFPRIVGARLLCRYGKHVLPRTARGLGADMDSGVPFEDRVEGIKNLLNLPVNVIPLCVVPVGHPAETPAPVDRFNPSCIHYEVW